MKSLNLQIITLCILGIFINILYSQSKINGVKPGVNPLHHLSGSNPGEYDRIILASKAELEERFNRQLYNGKPQLIHNNYLLNETEGAPEFERTKFANSYSSSLSNNLCTCCSTSFDRRFCSGFDTSSLKLFREFSLSSTRLPNFFSCKIRYLFFL